MRTDTEKSWDIVCHTDRDSFLTFSWWFWYTNRSKDWFWMVWGTSYLWHLCIKFLWVLSRWWINQKVRKMKIFLRSLSLICDINCIKMVHLLSLRFICYVIFKDRYSEVVFKKKCNTVWSAQLRRGMRFGSVWLWTTLVFLATLSDFLYLTVLNKYVRETRFLI